MEKKISDKKSTYFYYRFLVLNLKLVTLQVKTLQNSRFFQDSRFFGKPVCYIILSNCY